MSTWNRPRIRNSGITVDEMSATMILLLGGKMLGSVLLTQEQEKDLYKLYEFDPEKDKGDALFEAGAFRNMARFAEVDGIRLVAFLAKFCEPGKDPLSLVKVLMSEAGYDVSLEDRDLDEEDFDEEDFDEEDLDEEDLDESMKTLSTPP